MSVKNTELSIMIVLIRDIIKVEFLINAKRRNQKQKEKLKVIEKQAKADLIICKQLSII